MAEPTPKQELVRVDAPGLPAKTGIALALPEPEDEEGIGLRPIIIVVVVVVVTLFFGGLGGWAALAPLESAAIATGVVSVASSRKTVQHLEGGIVSEILVREGDEVEASQLLIRLEDTQPRASLELLRGRQLAALALEARLAAERDGRKLVEFPDALLTAAQDTKVAGMITAQERIFEARRNSLSGQVAILKQRMAQFSEEIKGLSSEIAAQDTQLELIAEESGAVAQLVAKGLAQKPRLLGLKRQSAEIEGARSRNRARIARVKQSIGEAHLRISELSTALINEVVQELRDVQTDLSDLTERIRAAEDVMRRTDILAPLAGTIVGLQVHTRGGVIAPGSPLMDIVPKDDRLIIEAQVDPNDIDVVHSGLPAQVRLTAFNQRHLAPIDGQVVSVSADRFTDERTGVGYFLARIELDAAELEALEDVALYPGMQAEVMIVTGARTAFDYLTKPLATSLRRAFREE